MSDARVEVAPPPGGGRRSPFAGDLDFWGTSPLSALEAARLNDGQLDDYLLEQISLIEKLGADDYARLAPEWRDRYLEVFGLAPRDCRPART